MAEIKCERCGMAYNDTNRQCPQCGWPAPELKLAEKQTQQSQTTASMDKKKPISKKIWNWGVFHIVLGWFSLIAIIVLILVGISEYWGEEFISLAYVAVGCIYFFLTGVILKGFAEITLKSEIILKKHGISLN